MRKNLTRGTQIFLMILIGYQMLSVWKWWGKQINSDSDYLKNNNACIISYNTVSQLQMKLCSQIHIRNYAVDYNLDGINKFFLNLADCQSLLYLFNFYVQQKIL